MTALLTMNRVNKTFSHRDGPVLREVSFSVEPGELFSLVGPSGCGKTTALRIVAGFERPDSGTVSLGERVLSGPRAHVAPEERGLGFVFQDYALFPHLSALDNVAFGLRKIPKAKARARALEALEMVHLAEAAHRYPAQLSGGQQQRVALARSLAPRPRVLLMDEPFSNLDAGMRLATRSEVRALLKASGTTTVLVTHDQEEAMTMGDRLAIMRDGRVEQADAPEALYRKPRTAFVAGFLGATNLLDAEADGADARSAIGRLILDRQAKGSVRVSLRPEQLVMSQPTENGPRGIITAREFKGHDQTYRVCLGGQELLVQSHSSCAWRPGDQVGLHVLDAAVVLDETPGAVPTE